MLPNHFPSLVLALLSASLLVAASGHAQEAANFSPDAYKGKVVLVDFWASWCGPCRQSMPWLRDLAARRRDQGLVVIGIDLDKDPAQGRAFLAKIPADFPILFDPAGNLAERYRLRGMPSTVLIDRTGAVRGGHVGFVPEKAADYEADVISLLNEP